MVIYCYVDRMWRIIVTPHFLHNIYDHGNIIQVKQLIYICNH